MISTVIYLSSLAVTLLAESLTKGKSRRVLEKISRGFWKAREEEDEEEEMGMGGGWRRGLEAVRQDCFQLM